MTSTFDTAAAAGRLRLLRLSLGYDTAASFARAIGYHPDTYSRYERAFLVRGSTLIRLVHAIEQVGPFSLDWLIMGDLDRQPPGRPGEKVAILGRGRRRR